MNSISLSIPCDPVPASRPRVTRFGRTYYEKRYAAFKKSFKEQLVEWASANRHIMFARTAVLSLRLMINVTRPPTTKLSCPMPDVDNYAKAVMDAGNEVLWEDDTSVRCLLVEKSWDSSGSVSIEVDTIPGRDTRVREVKS